MKALVVVASLVALACGALKVQEKDQDRGANGKKHEGMGIKVIKPSQAEWKQDEKMPAGVMKAQVCESKTGGTICLVKIPAGTKFPAHTAMGAKVIHVHSGSLEISQAPATAGRGGQDQPGRGQDQPGRGEGLSGQAQTASEGDIITISANTTYTITAKTETMALVAMESKSDASGQRSSEDPENKVK